MITGQLLFEALELGSWAGLSDERQSHYNMLAEKLNQQYLASIQGAITGQAIHRLYLENQPFKDDFRLWDDIHPLAQATYNALAEQLNAQYLAPLQGLVREYQALQQETFDAFYQNVGNPEELSTKMSQLEERTKELLNDEQKG